METLSEKMIKIHDLQVQINTKKRELTDSDYMVIKSLEYSQQGKECEYDMENIYADRQTLRDEINELQIKLKEMADES